MAEETGKSVVMTRPTSPIEGAELLQRLRGDEPGAAERDMIRLRDGHVLISMPQSPDFLKEKLMTDFGAGIDEHVFVEEDRRLFRVAPMFAEVPQPERANTWNLDAVGIVGGKQATGKGAIVAVLDSGLDFAHPDFPRVNRVLRVVDNSAVDENGHGTHCAGIIGGPRRPNRKVPRYGIAPDAELVVVNVYDGNGHETSDWDLLLGIVGAADKGANIISISVGRVPTEVAPAFSGIFELVANILMDWYDTIIVAAAGNESDRMEPYIGPIVHPADCPSIIAVAAVNENLQPSRTSSGGLAGQREPALAAPGVGIFSSFLTHGAGPDGPYLTLNGTSAAAPHVAGVAALWLEKGFKGRALSQQLLATSKPLSAPNGKRDVGVGLIQAP
jgi:subtilisin family serine protease